MRGPMPMRLTRACWTLSGLVVLAAPAASADADFGTAAFADRNDPPAYRTLMPAERQAYDLGHAVFNTQWVAAATAGAGAGPLLNAASCDACHNEGARGRGPTGDGPAPAALVIQLETPQGEAGVADAGDPAYGHVFNPMGLGMAPEGEVQIRYTPIDGRYPDGMPWHLREPHYRLTGLNYGPLAQTTIIRPRLAPALFGVGLLQAVAQTDVDLGSADAENARAFAGWWRPEPHGPGRFGWQAATVTIREQTTRAMAREMGLTSPDVPNEECTLQQSNCQSERRAAEPEVREDLLQPLVSFLRWLAVPRPPGGASETSAGSALFARCRCTACHRPSLPVMDPAENGTMVPRTIRPYTDLWLHDLGVGLADRDLQGKPPQTRWRTAPLWGTGYAVRSGRDTTFLHDGRARSPEEAILWHGGEADPANRCFQALPLAQRRRLLDWLVSL